MTILDYIFFALLAFAFIMGLWKGFLKQVFALVGVVIVSIGTTYLAPYPNEWLKSIIAADSTRSIVAMVVTFLALLIVYSIITKIISKAVNKSNALGWINRLLGAIFGIAVVYLTFSVFVALIVGTDESFLQGIKSLVEAPLKDSWIVNNIYGGYENPEKNFFGNWLIKTLLEKIQEIMPAIPQMPATPSGE